MSTALLFLCSFVLIVTGAILMILVFIKDHHPVLGFIGAINIVLGFTILMITCIEIGKQGNSDVIRIECSVGNNNPTLFFLAVLRISFLHCLIVDYGLLNPLYF